jgi:hypothetical protein
MIRRGFIVLLAASIAGCASTAPVSIGGDTYYASKTNTAGAFGNVGAVAGALMADGNAFCVKKGLEFQLVTQETRPPVIGSSLGGASITFRCVVHSENPTMRKDNGVTTIERITK